MRFARHFAPLNILALRRLLTQGTHARCCANGCTMPIGCCQPSQVARRMGHDPDCDGGEEGMATKVAAEVTGLVWKIEKKWAIWSMLGTCW